MILVAQMFSRGGERIERPGQFWAQRTEPPCTAPYVMNIRFAILNFGLRQRQFMRHFEFDPLIFTPAISNLKSKLGGDCGLGGGRDRDK